MLAAVQMTKSVHAATFLDNPNLVFIFDLLVFNDSSLRIVYVKM